MKKVKIILGIVIIFFVILISYNIVSYKNMQSVINQSNSSKLSINAGVDVGISPEEYLEAGEKNYTNAFSRAIKYLGTKGGGSIILAPNKIYNGDIIINQPNITITGGGRLKGSIVCDYSAKSQDIYCNIDNIQFLPSEKNYSVKLERAIYAKILNCKFDKGIDKAILIDQRNSYKANKNFKQMSRRIIITNNIFNSNYSIYREAYENDSFIDLADVTFTDNQCANYICNVYLDGIDGFICRGNTFFLPGSKDKNKYKTYNVYIARANWTIINANNCFESGLESIKVENVENINIDSNNIAWAGQRIPSTAISLSNGNIQGKQKNISSIANNIINRPSKHGIEVINGGYVKVNDNLVYSAGINSPYYGDVELNSIPHYGVYVTKSINVYAINNVSPDNNNNIDSEHYDNIEKDNQQVTK